MRFLLCLFLGLGLSASAQETPESLAQRAAGSYQAIPHQYSRFQAETSGLDPITTEQLRQYYMLLDAAVVTRVEAMKGLERRRSDAFATYDNRQAQIVLQLQMLGRNSRLSGVVQEALAALADQKAFFEEWSAQPGPKAIAGHPKVTSASGHLKQAYSKLQKVLGKASENTQKCNYDVHCALDFI